MKTLIKNIIERAYNSYYVHVKEWQRFSSHNDITLIDIIITVITLVCVIFYIYLMALVTVL